ncbi:TPA: HD domain-containing protein [Klebsiella pneumoniae]|uniref:HD domain-containing protein n=1 Tax=Klebsiella pneumoniae TaxID=573 RepID=UPI000DE6D512|nr:HD domain-containing protein [Klebsiella pneumoniae]HCB0927428.1 HD domain-containing protein [Klebsiella variicola subsp. variicola]SSN99536.1 deoxyguanosinetriphosphate triphosphohydrolase [Klebsiella pneumoniae]SSW04727.1 deoxyguanosinetriphosphate triphosphohydrolase [Klebsiella pneumoniae]HBS6091920.1 HD domain-containing protein [Klebsiella pneumoniae]HBY5144995.1 HD domain-containing protein [Klebsiella pneumoniae]
MDIENELTRKILDPIHGIIRLTALEIEFINHPLYQRLRNIKQNSFLYKVFPSAVHSRFEHSLGVLHLSNEILKNLHLNTIRYGKKYDDGHVFNTVSLIPKHNVQELRLAALMHDIGHGPMSHQFDIFMPTKKELIEFLDKKYHKVLDVLTQENEQVEHEHLSLIFCLVIFNDLKKRSQVSEEIDVENIFKIIDKKYGNQQILTKVCNKEVDILPLMTSIISSCPIDADRMDYLLRDSYFSGVKCGLYDYNRLFMSIVPVEENDKIYLAYKESGLDSIAEFIGARSSLFSQVYFHKTNRAFSSMLNKLCEVMIGKSNKNLIISDIYEGSASVPGPDDGIKPLTDFYIDCSDDYFLNEKVAEWVDETKTVDINKKILDDIINRHPWSKIYEAKHSLKNASITDKDNGELRRKIQARLQPILGAHFQSHEYFIDVVSDTAFKDIDKTEIKLLIKNVDNTYKIKSLSECGDKLDQYQSIKYFIRVFIDRDLKGKVPSNIIKEINNAVMEEVTPS